MLLLTIDSVNSRLQSASLSGRVAFFSEQIHIAPKPLANIIFRAKNRTPNAPYFNLAIILRQLFSMRSSTSPLSARTKFSPVIRS